MEPQGLTPLIFYSLDESEASIRKYSGKSKYRYFGVLHVEDINWISPDGRRLIQDDMRRRGFDPSLGK